MDEVSIGGVLYPIKFSFNTRRLFCKDKGIELFEFEELFSKEDTTTLKYIENLSLFILYGFKEGARKSGKEFALTIDDIVECFTEEPDAISQAVEAYRESEARSEGKLKAPDKVGV